MVYMPLLMNITPEGINNNELANLARVTKQAMSKVAKELQNLGYIKAKIDPRDKRSMVIMLTDRGKKLVVDTRLRVMELTDQYRFLIVEAEFERATEVIRKVMDYNDNQLLNRK